MAMINYLKERKSTRDFDLKELSNDDISNLKNAVESINEKFGWNDIKLDFIEDGEKVSKVFDGKAGYAGVFIDAPSYVSLAYSEMDPFNIIKGAFVIGELTTKLIDLGLGHCVVTIEENLVDEKNEVFGVIGENIDYLIAIGYPSAKKAFDKEVTSSRLGVDEIAFLDEGFTEPATDKLRNMNMLEIFSALKLAPSYKNKQPWRFLIDDKEVEIFVKNDEDIKKSLTDIGLSMYYFQNLASTMGINGNWDIVTSLDNVGEYIKVGRFKL